MKNTTYFLELSVEMFVCQWRAVTKDPEHGAGQQPLAAQGSLSPGTIGSRGTHFRSCICVIGPNRFFAL